MTIIITTYMGDLIVMNYFSINSTGTLGCLDICSNLALGASRRVFLDEINI